MAADRNRSKVMALVAVAYLAGLAAYSRLPGAFLAATPSARLQVAFTLPTVALAIEALFRSLWKHDRIRTGNGAFKATYDAIVLRVVLFVVTLHVLVMIELTGATAVLGVRWPVGRVVVVLFGIALVAIGNLLPRTRPNVAVGVRTARTLASTQLWQSVHRAGGYATVALGVTIALAGAVLTKETMGPVVAAAALACAAAVVMQYRRRARA